MISRIVGIGMLLGAMLSALADGERLRTLKAGSETYTDVTITSVSATEIFFTHSRGLGNAKLKSLEPSLQKMFHFDPAKANEQQAEQARANALYNQGLKDTQTPRRPPLGRAEDSAEIKPPATVNGIPKHPIHAKSFLNQQAPELQIEKWITEPPVTSGRFVLLDFWATWCGPCRQSIPHLNALQAKFRDRLVVIGLSDESERAVRAMIQPKIEYAIAIDPRQRTSTAVEVKGIPHTMLIDPSGVVRFEGMPHYLNEKGLEMLLTKFSK